MKILRILLIIFVIYLLKVSFVFASNDNLLLAITSYNTPEQLSVLFANSIRTLNYIPREQKSVFVSLISEEQKEILVAKGFILEIIDQEPDLTRYVLLNHPEPNQAEKVSHLGKVYELTPYDTLLKLAEGQSFTYEGELVKFFIIPFANVEITPPSQMIIPSPTLVKQPTITSPPVKEKPLLPTWAGVLVGVYVIGIFASLIIIWKKDNLSRKVLIGVLIVISVILVGILFYVKKMRLSQVDSRPLEDARYDIEADFGEF